MRTAKFYTVGSRNNDPLGISRRPAPTKLSRRSLVQLILLVLDYHNKSLSESVYASRTSAGKPTSQDHFKAIKTVSERPRLLSASSIRGADRGQIGKFKFHTWSSPLLPLMQRIGADGGFQADPAWLPSW